MTKQNIYIALISLVALIVFWLSLCFFIKIDISCSGMLSVDNGYNQISLNAADASYIESHNIQKIKIQYNHQYYDCSIQYVDGNESVYNYSFWTSTQSIVVVGYEPTHVVIRSVNVYEYILKK